jgi:hypothetical protein
MEHVSEQNSEYFHLRGKAIFDAENYIIKDLSVCVFHVIFFGCKYI